MPMQENPTQENKVVKEQQDAAEAGTEETGQTRPAAEDQTPGAPPAEVGNEAGDQVDPAAPEIDIEALQLQLKKEAEQAEANRELALRTRADMENLRKRTARDIENAHKYALQGFVNELLPIMDSLQLGLAASGDTDNIKELRAGMELTLKMFGAALDKFGVRMIDPLDEKFNPEQHEAVSMQEAEGKASGTVISVMQKGYELNGRLIRAATVMVAK